MKKYTIKVLCIVTLLLSSVSFAYDEPVQISVPRFADHSLHYGLPSWFDYDGFNKKESLPDDDSFIYLDLNNPLYSNLKIDYAGKKYDYVSIAKNGRMYLGKLPKDFVVPVDGSGSYPYLEITKNNILPVDGASSVPVKWFPIQQNTKFALIQVGPFNVEGYFYKWSYQIFLYTDGEIQFQPWIHYEGNKHPQINSDDGNVHPPIYNLQYGDYKSSPLLNVTARGEFFHPAMYTGGEVIKADYKEMFKMQNDYLVKNGELRPGWIAKSFDTLDTKFTKDADGLVVDFGKKHAAGGLIAYDNSREHPVVGSYNHISLDAVSITYGYDRDANNPVPVAFWYFGYSNDDVISQSDYANYPCFMDNQVVYQKEPLINYGAKYPYNIYGPYIVIFPIAYEKSWNELRLQGKDVEKTLAIALKFQTQDDKRQRRGFGRVIKIRNVAVSLRQPRLAQFLPPETHEMTFKTNGLAYMKGVNFPGKFPYTFLHNSLIEGEIIPAPGEEIEEVLVNNVSFYNIDGSASYLAKNPDGSISVKWAPVPMDIDVYVKVKSCGPRVLDPVSPSFVKNELYIDPSNRTRKFETYSIRDGLGREVQTQSALDNGNYRVSATYLDDFGNVEFAPLPYLSPKGSFAYEDMYCKQCVIQSSRYYNGSDSVERPDAFGVPYTKTDYLYGEDNGVSSEVAGVGNRSFGRWTTTAKQWIIPVDAATSSKFMPLSQLNETDLTSIYRERKRQIIEDGIDYNYTLVINRSTEGVFTQQIFDGAGNIMLAWANIEDSIVISRTNYNSDNQVDSVDISVDYAPFTLVTKYTYDYAGRIKSVESKDKGKVITVYDSDDNVRFTQDARQRAMGANYFSVIDYDKEGRVIRTGEVRGGHLFSKPDETISDNNFYIRSKVIYGKPLLDSLKLIHVSSDEDLLKNILDSIDVIFPNEVGASISFDGNKSASDANLKANSLKMSSYDRIGRLLHQWTVYGLDDGLATKVSYSYKTSGELDHSESFEWKNGGWNHISTIGYEYDPRGRVKKIFEDGKLLAEYERLDGGTVSKTSIYDKGSPVYSRTYAKDIYGRTLRVDYVDGSGKNLYSENVSYPSVVAGRLDSAEHSWDGYSSQEYYSYDKIGRLIGFNTNNYNIGGYGKSYEYDALGRLTKKNERGSNISYTYANDSFQPKSMNVNDGGDSAYYSYDASGNVWLDRRTKSSYRINSFGLPDVVSNYSDVPSSISVADVYAGKDYVEKIGSVHMAYDEGGNRIWTHTRGAGMDFEEVSMPGVGEFYTQHVTASSGYTLRRLDLIGGGYRNGLGGEALFPVKDVQGSVRGYVAKTGLKSAFGYRPYGMSVDLMTYSGDDNRRWQGKEFDGEHGKYYFGARYYDPFFGMWMSPDPAGQFANPYTYGGDPLNFIDPTGLWNLGMGLVFGWDKSHGWSVGVGVAGSLGNNNEIGVDFAYMWNGDGSQSLNLGGNAKIAVQWAVYVEFNMGLSYSRNTYTGSTLSTSGGVCVGEAGTCLGIESGGSMYWDSEGNYMGATVFTDVYVSVAGGLGKITALGYEQGFGMEGRGFYTGVSGLGIHAEATQKQGYSYGFQEKAYLAYGNNSIVKDGFTDKNGNKSDLRLVSLEMWLPTLGKLGHFTFGETVNVFNGGMASEEKIKDIFSDDRLYEAYKNAETADKKFKILNDAMAERNYFNAKHLNLFHLGEKVTYAKKGFWGNYGNVEFIIEKDNSGKVSNMEASYNFANHWWTHLFVDVIGWYARYY